MSDGKIQVDISRARAKISALKGVDRLMRKKLTFWMADTIYHIKRMISGTYLGTKTSQLKRNVGGKAVEFGSGAYGLMIGTGPDVGLSEVIYASIQEHGGTIRPKKRKWLTVPLPGVKGTVSNYPDGFFIKSKAGNLLFVIRKGKYGIQPLFVLKKEVKIPASHWLTQSIKDKQAELEKMLDPNQLVGDMMEGLRGSGIQD